MSKRLRVSVTVFVVSALLALAGTILSVSASGWTPVVWGYAMTIIGVLGLLVACLSAEEDS